ncbi:LysR family transcriptional regulator [Levilactobacillus brevis]|nr:LysR family transcriptional regulator [Levilactobacillus brevis]KIO98396.1 LysR family transcriptional regulator YeiE [Levilactobacillus brevis]MCT3572566.1 LysR family transcriptional regulator [Levilactobacillus brevis]SQG75200.1 HTH-type transcriptional regulator CysL [Levilactobacillus brevis]
MLDKRYETLLVLVQTKSYTQTAQRLFITQPAVSQQIKSLEMELNVKLVRYQRPRLTITPAGQELAAFVQRIQVQANKVVTALQHPQVTRQVIFSTTLSLSEFLAPQLIQAIQATQQFRDIQCRVTNTQAALTAIDRGTSDFALIEGNFDKTRYDYQIVREEPFVAVVAANHPLAQQAQVSWADLTAYPLLLRELGSGSREILTNLAQAANVTLAEFSQTVTINNLAAIRQLLLRGAGISFVYRSVVASELTTGKLVTLRLPAGELLHELAVVYARDSFFAADYQRWTQALRQPGN